MVKGHEESWDFVLLTMWQFCMNCCIEAGSSLPADSLKTVLQQAIRDHFWTSLKGG